MIAFYLTMFALPALLIAVAVLAAQRSGRRGGSGPHHGSGDAVQEGD